MNHQDWLQQAIQLACDNVAKGGGPFGALVVKNDELIAQSGNRVTSQLDPTAHAEIQAIRLACQTLSDFQLTDCVLYSSCEPCPMCLGASYWARLQAVYFAADRNDAAQGGFDDLAIYQELALPFAERKMTTQQILITQANRPFQEWLALANKTPY